MKSNRLFFLIGRLFTFPSVSPPRKLYSLKKKENSRETNLGKEEESEENLENLFGASIFFASPFPLDISPLKVFSPFTLFPIQNTDSLRRVDHRDIASFSLAWIDKDETKDSPRRFRP